MDIVGRSKEFLFKICSKIEDRLADLLAGVILATAVVVCVVFWEWAKTKHSLETYGWLWILASTVFLFLMVYSLRSALQHKGRLRDPGDIISTIDAWLADGDQQSYPVDLGTPNSFRALEKELHLRRGSSLKYLPMCALKHDYAFEMGHETFTLKRLTRDNDPRDIIQEYLGTLSTKDEEEFVVHCSDIENRIGWPKGAFKSFLLIRPPLANEKHGYQAVDAGGDRVRIKRKN